MFILFGVNSIDELKERVSKCQREREMGYNGSFDCAPAITNYIKVEEIGEWS